jgi:hypothetical protein
MQLLREQIRKRTILIHLGHELDHAAISVRLPPGVELAFDGLTVPLTGL